MDPTTPQAPDDRDREHGSEDTQTLQTSPTQGYAVAQQTWEGGEPTAYPRPSSAQPEPVRPTGTSWATVVLGLVALIVGGMVLTFQLIDLDIDWSIATPMVFVGAGGLLVLLGVAALVSRRNAEEEPG